MRRWWQRRASGTRTRTIAAGIRREKPAKARRKDVEARWTVKHSRAEPAADGKPRIDIAIPAFGYRSPISVERRHGVIRRAKVTGASAHDGARRREDLIDPNDTACDVRADSACRSAENERFLAGMGKVSRIHPRKPKGRPMPKRTVRANAARSAVRAFLEHPFAHRKGPMGPVMRTVGLARGTAAARFATIAYTLKRWCWLAGRTVPA